VADLVSAYFIMLATAVTLDVAGITDIETAVHAVNESPANGTLPPEYWGALLRYPQAAGKSRSPIQQMRLSEIPRELLRADCFTVTDYCRG
jgi:hypothetical protein